MQKVFSNFFLRITLATLQCLMLWMHQINQNRRLKQETSKQKKVWTHFFLVGDQSYIANSCNQDTDQSEPSKDQRKNVTVDISVESPKTKNAKTSIKRDKIDEFTAQLVDVNAFFMNEVFELENEIARLKEAFLNVRNSFPEENLNTENLKCQISM